MGRDSCMNCKKQQYREGHQYPYRCLKDRNVSYSENGWIKKSEAEPCKYYVRADVRGTEDEQMD